MEQPDVELPAVHVVGLTKNYGEHAVLTGVDLEVRRGEVFALLGPNGAGKSTMVNILTGFLRRSGGTVSVLGADPQRPDFDWRARVGVVAQTTGGLGEVTVREAVEHFARLYPTPRAAGDVVEMVGLTDSAGVRADQLSGGQRRRLDIALAVVGRPELVFLDEPTTGLDPEARRLIWTLVRRLVAEGATIVLTTHYLDEVDALAGRTAVLLGGTILDCGPTQEIGARRQAAAWVAFRPTGPLRGAALPHPLPLLPVAGVPRPAALAAMLTGGGDDMTVLRTERPTELVGALGAWAGVLGAGELPHLTVLRPSLEDVYLSMIANPGRRVPADTGSEGST